MKWGTAYGAMREQLAAASPPLVWTNRPFAYGVERRASYRGHHIRVWRESPVDGSPRVWRWVVRAAPGNAIVAEGHETALHRAKAMAVAVAVHRWTR